MSAFEPRGAHHHAGARLALGGINLLSDIAIALRTVREDIRHLKPESDNPSLHRFQRASEKLQQAVEVHKGKRVSVAEAIELSNLAAKKDAMSLALWRRL